MICNSEPENLGHEAPFSMKNIEEVYKIASEKKIPVVLEMSNIVCNAKLI